jgi:hypothetical protein
MFLASWYKRQYSWFVTLDLHPEDGDDNLLRNVGNNPTGPQITTQNTVIASLIAIRTSLIFLASILRCPVRNWVKKPNVLYEILWFLWLPTSESQQSTIN